jgi:aspartyl-tRNA(Asn)/glutamyl-tRNA(Gln) amidotransferase subunit B
MAQSTARSDYQPVIGLEVHAQLRAESKIFCACANAYGEPPNSLTCPVCLGLPGALPVLNERAVELAVRIIHALDGQVQEVSTFARKNYFYPDLPKGYQITQYDLPLGTDAGLTITLDSGREKRIPIERIHLEEDAGKLLHPDRPDLPTRVDLNRCGVPLIEIVTSPEIASPEEAIAYLTTLKQILQYIEACTGDMEKGHLRYDANVSVSRRGSNKRGMRTELKNLNSFKAVERALAFEIDRQAAVLSAGGQIQQATLMWNERTQKSEAMRIKEESEDYRYSPEPDLPPLILESGWIDGVRKSLPELPFTRRKRLVDRYRIRPYDVFLLTATREMADFFEEAAGESDDVQALANWLNTELLGYLKATDTGIGDLTIKPGHVRDLVNRICRGELTGKYAKSVFAEMLNSGQPPAAVLQGRDSRPISDESVLGPMVSKLLEENEAVVAKFRAGKTSVVGFFVGETMRVTEGRADPKVVHRILIAALERDEGESAES